MSNKNRTKGTNQMSQDELNQTTEETTTEAQPAVLDGGDAAAEQTAPAEQTTNEVVAETVAEPQPEPVPQPEPEPTPKEIKVGTVVDPNQGKLGKAASAETVTRVTSASTAAPEVKTTAFEQKIAKIMATGSTREKFVISSLQSYIDTVAVGKPVDVDTGVRAQQSLYRTILNVVNSDDDFTNAFKLMISFIREHRAGVFADTHAFRFFEYAKPGQEWPTTLRNMLTLLIVAAGVNNKKEVHKIVRVSKAVQTGMNEAARQRVIQYFQ